LRLGGYTFKNGTCILEFTKAIVTARQTEVNAALQLNNTVLSTPKMQQSRNQTRSKKPQKSLTIQQRVLLYPGDIVAATTLNELKRISITESSEAFHALEHAKCGLRHTVDRFSVFQKSRKLK
jgi:hypothetical protein